MTTATQHATSAEFAAGVRDYFIQRLEAEHPTTLRVMENVKPGDWRPDPKARTAREIAWHIAHSEIWFLESLISGKFDPSTAADPAVPNSMAEIIQYYSENFKKLIPKAKKVSGEKMAAIVDFFGMKNPMFEFLGFTMVHTVHHRAQLSTYLRPLGGKCPDIYGGSADEPWQPTT